MLWLDLFLSIRDSDCRKLLLHVQVSRGLDLGPQLGPPEAKKGTSMDYMQETEQYFSLNFKKITFFFFWYEVLYPWCALWCLNKFDMLSFQGLSFLHTWLFQLISLFPIWKMANSSEDVILNIPAVLIFCISLARENDFTGHDMSRSAYLMAA